MDVITTGAAVGIALVALGLVLTPGPNMIYLVSRSVGQGRRAGLVSLIGTGLGFLVYLIAAAAGVAAVFAAVPTAYIALKVGGAAYLFWLAWSVLRPGAGSPLALRSLPHDSDRRLIAFGFLTNLLNPKIAILYVSLLPQFVDPERGSVVVQSLVLGSIQIVVALTVNALIVVGAGGLANSLATRPAWARVQRYAMGTLLGAFAVRMVTDPSPAST